MLILFFCGIALMAPSMRRGDSGPAKISPILIPVFICAAAIAFWFIAAPDPQIRVWLSVLVCVAVFLSRRYIFTALAKVDKILIAACRLCFSGRVGRRLFYLNLVRHRRYCGRRDVEPCVFIFGWNCFTSPINDQSGFLDSGRCVAGQLGACSKSFSSRTGTNGLILRSRGLQSRKHTQDWICILHKGNVCAETLLFSLHPIFRP